jgi:hypothetical protein
VDFVWDRYLRADDYDSERYEQLLLGQFRPLLRSLVFRLMHAIGRLFPQHDTQDFFVLGELAFVVVIRELKSEQVAPAQFVSRLPTRCLFRMLKLLRSEFQFPSSAVWDLVVRGAELPSSVLDIILTVRIEDLPAPSEGDDLLRDELWPASQHRDLDPQSALELRELAQEIWSGLCAGELRVPEKWQQKDELIAFLRDCGLQISELDYKRMLRRNKARRLRARRMDEESR